MQSQIKKSDMRDLLKTRYLILVMITLCHCSVEPVEFSSETKLNEQTEDQNNLLTCSNLDPTARFTNNGTVSFDLTLFDDNMDIISQELNVLPGTSTNWVSFPVGDVLFSLNSNTTGVVDAKVLFSMDTCMEFNLTINPDNTLATNQPIQL